MSRKINPSSKNLKGTYQNKQGKAITRLWLQWEILFDERQLKKNKISSERKKFEMLLTLYYFDFDQKKINKAVNNPLIFKWIAVGNPWFLQLKVSRKDTVQTGADTIPIPPPQPPIKPPLPIKELRNMIGNLELTTEPDTIPPKPREPDP